MWLRLSRKYKGKWLKRKDQAINDPIHQDFPYQYQYDRSYDSPYAGHSGEPNLSFSTDQGIKMDPEKYIFQDKMVP